MLRKIFFAAGGTGGHIYPAIAVADEIRKIYPDTQIVFIGAKGRIEENIVPPAGYELITLDVEGFERKLNLKNIKILFKAVKSLKKAEQILNEHRPEVVFGTGGFASGPVIRAAQQQKIRTVLMEGNYYPGFTTRLLASRADMVILNFRESEKYLKRKDNIVFIGYPFRKSLKRIPRTEAVSYFGLSENKKTLLVTGGSQGARAVNSTVLENYTNLIDNGIQIIWQTGNPDFEKINSHVTNPYIRVFRYLEKIDIAYSACDLSLSRAGISTISELAFLGVPSVLVPFPRSSADHQKRNAELLVKNNAAIMCEEKDLDNFLKNKITAIIHDEQILEKLSSNITTYADTDAARKIAALLENFKDKSVI
jgi:UDP-N-acetylglucosamine--N-acetylmuramyl-(pentapeptide) pyrophosphoryl-undecaprenol N-acetylglucosamine transferase